jgi:hypothetical protein
MCRKERSEAEKKGESRSESDRNYIKVKQRGTQRWETHRRQREEIEGVPENGRETELAAALLTLMEEIKGVPENERETELAAALLTLMEYLRSS